MASLGHIAVAIFAAPLAAPRTDSRRAVAVHAFNLTVASMLPDADVVAFALRIPYAHAFGHRGASHSFAFALIIAALAALGAKYLRLSRVRAALAYGLVTASHPLLDMLTDGGLGVALFFPFSNARLFFPWRPIPVAPIGAGIFSDYGFHVLATELVYFAPLLMLAAVALHFRHLRRA